MLEAKESGYVYANKIEREIRIVYGNTPITFLDKGKEVKIAATVKEGIGQDHSKFMPGMIYYEEVLNVEANSKVKNMVDACSHGMQVLSKSKKGAKEIYSLKICESCLEEYEKQNGSLENIGDEELLITVESFGQLKPKEILLQSVSTLKRDLSRVVKQIK